MYDMNLKKPILTLLLMLSLLPLSAQEQADTSYVFRFQAGNDMFYVPFGENGMELQRLGACVERYKEDILAGRTPLHVDGYCSSAATGKENLAIARTRSNRVKSELIVRSGLTESCFITHNHSGSGDYVTVCLTVIVRAEQTEPDSAAIERKRTEKERLAARQATREKAEAGRLEAEQAEKERLAEEERNRLQAEEATQATRKRQDAGGWYAGIQGSVPFGVSAFSSFGADKTRAGWSVGVYGGYRFNPILSLEAQAAWGETNASVRSCCAGYWLGSDGNRYEAAVAGMEGWSYGELKSRVATQRYGVQLNVNLLGLFATTKRSRWTLELSPQLSAVGTKATFRTIADNAGAMKGATRWHFGAGGNVQAGYALTGHLHISIYTGITYLTGKPLDGTTEHLHKANYIWESGLKLGWSFGEQRKEAGK